MGGWKHSEQWHKRGNNFLIEVKHWTEEPYHRDEGEHRWAVYAYIYPKHPYFNQFQGDGIWQDATTNMPLHGDCTFLHYYMQKDNEVTSIKVGADYHHMDDEPFTFHQTKEEAWKVFRDAEELFKWMEEKGGE